jgi:hypothetical protein
MMGTAGVDAATLIRLQNSRKSVNDLLRAEITALKNRPQLSSDDSLRLQQHFDSVRDVEVKLGCNVDTMKQQQLAGATTMLDNDDFIETVAKLQFDVIALAIACGDVRVATLQMGGGGSHTEFTDPRNGTRMFSYHGISHRIRGDGNFDPNIAIPNADQLHHQIDRIHARLFKYLLDRLSAYGVMDSTISIWCNDMSVGVGHNYNDVPFVIAGSGNGYLKQGQFMTAGGVMVNKLLNTLVNAVGVRNTDGSLITNFGDPALAPGELLSIKA